MFPSFCFDPVTGMLKTVNSYSAVGPFSYMSGFKVDISGRIVVIAFA